MSADGDKPYLSDDINVVRKELIAAYVEAREWLTELSREREKTNALFAAFDQLHSATMASAHLLLDLANDVGESGDSKTASNLLREAGRLVAEARSARERVLETYGV